MFRQRPIPDPVWDDPRQQLRAARATQTEKGELTRNTILERALQSFRDKGFEATTMRDVANQAGVALGAAYPLQLVGCTFMGPAEGAVPGAG